jgi:hypothetical protein
MEAERLSDFDPRDPLSRGGVTHFLCDRAHETDQGDRELSGSLGQRHVSGFLEPHKSFRGCLVDERFLRSREPRAELPEHDGEGNVRRQPKHPDFRTPERTVLHPERAAPGAETEEHVGGGIPEGLTLTRPQSASQRSAGTFPKLPLAASTKCRTRHANDLELPTVYGA